MESKQQSQARDAQKQYEAPSVVVLGTLAEMTAGNKSGSSGDYSKGYGFPSR